MKSDQQNLRIQVQQMARNVCEFLMANAQNVLSMNPTMSQAMIGRIALESSPHWTTQSYVLDNTPFLLKHTNKTIEVVDTDTLQSVAVKIAQAEIEHELERRGYTQPEREEMSRIAQREIEDFFGKLN